MEKKRIYIPNFLTELISDKDQSPKIIRWIKAMEKIGLPVSEKTKQKAMMQHSEYFPEKKTAAQQGQSFANHMKKFYGSKTQG